MLMEIFAGRATLSDLARRVGSWEVLPPQDILYGLDLRRKADQDLMKDVIKQQMPDVITLSPPCEPWSSWQRMRKRKDVVNALRQEYKPFWEFVCWVWAFQNHNGGLVLLEQPSQSDALRQPMMSRREHVYQKDIHMCRLGLVDYTSWVCRARSRRRFR